MTRQQAHRPLSSVLVATTGYEGQVVPLAVQLLQAAGYELEHAVVLHSEPAAAGIAAALGRMRAAFAAEPGWPRLQQRPLPVADVLSQAELEHYGEALFQEVRRWLGAGYQVNLLLAGGRKPMAMLGMSIAQMLFGPEDRVWYLYSNEALRASGRYRLGAGDEAYLVPIPVLPWSLAPPILTGLAEQGSTREALAWQQRQLLARKQRFWRERLTRAEREVASLLVRSGATDEELAVRLHKSPRTISHQLASVYCKLRAFLGVREGVRVDRHTLISELAPLFAVAEEI